MPDRLEFTPNTSQAHPAAFAPHGPPPSSESTDDASSSNHSEDTLSTIPTNNRRTLHDALSATLQILTRPIFQTPRGIFDPFGISFAVTLSQHMANHAMNLALRNVPIAGHTTSTPSATENPPHRVYKQQYGVDIGFWPEFYRDVYNLDEEHYIAKGERLGYTGSPWASIPYYRSRYVDIGEAHPLDHMMDIGLREGRQLSPYFDPKFYIAKYPDLQNAFGPLTDPKERNGALLKHYIIFGCDEGRQASENCCAATYLRRYPDVAREVGENQYKKGMMHYYKFGLADGKSASPFLDLGLVGQLRALIDKAAEAQGPSHQAAMDCLTEQLEATTSSQQKLTSQHNEILQRVENIENSCNLIQSQLTQLRAMFFHPHSAQVLRQGSLSSATPSHEGGDDFSLDLSGISLESDLDYLSEYSNQTEV